MNSYLMCSSCFWYSFNKSKFSILLRIGEEFPDTEYYTGNSDLEQMFNLQLYTDTDIDWYEHCLED